MNERKKQRRLVPRLIVVPLSSHYLDEDDIEIEQENDGFYQILILILLHRLILQESSLCITNAFISLEISSQFLIFFSLFSFILAWTFISLQIKEFQIMGLSINDSVYSCVFFFLTGLHFFHLLFGLLLLILLFWSCSFSFQTFFSLLFFNIFLINFLILDFISLSS